MSWEYTPPDRGRGLGRGIGSGSASLDHCGARWAPQGEDNGAGNEEETQSGPSDYARRAWIKGLERHRSNVDCVGEETQAPASATYSLVAEDDREDARGVSEGRRHRRARRRSGFSAPVAASLLALAAIPLAGAAPPIVMPRRRDEGRLPSRLPRSPALHAVVPTPTATILASGAGAGAGVGPASPPPSVTVSAQPTPVFATADWDWTKRDGVQYITSAEPPTVMPTDTRNVPETALPYLLSPGSDGSWTRVQGGWKLYGRQVADATATAPSDPQATQTATWAVESALPPGWGSQSTRTDFYRVPLIVVAAVILAVSIVVWISVTAFKRRKAHRRQKRRAERLRKRALAAAGLSEEDARGEEAQRKFQEKLDELQQERRMKKGEKFGAVPAGTGTGSGRNGREAKGERARNSQVKVRLWSATLGLRRRRGGRPGGGGGSSADDTPRPSSPVDAGMVEPKPDDPALNTNISRDRGDRGSQDTDRSTPTVPSSHTALESGLPSRENTATEDSTESRDRMSSLGSSLSRNRDSPEHDREHDTQDGLGPGTGIHGSGSGGGAYFPPAYRPASVRSLPAASSSRQRDPSHSGFGSGRDGRDGSGQGSSSPGGNDNGNEKMHAPGYYPAPSTAEGEVALAVASRAEGKQRMVDVDPAPGHDEGSDGSEERRAQGHVATDDKRVLEQMRLAASAPPQSQPANSPEGYDGLAIETGRPGAGGMAEEGPSAPHIPTDPDGFELPLPLPLDLGSPFAPDPLSLNNIPRSPASPATATFASHQLHPDLPLPPPRRTARTLSMREQVEQEVHEQLDELNLLPSAPPLGRAISQPSAPPDLEMNFGDEDEHDHRHGEQDGNAPSAPLLTDGDAGEGGEGIIPGDAGAGDRAHIEAPSAPPLPDDMPAEDHAHDHGGGARRPEGRFLPQYEP